MGFLDSFTDGLQISPSGFSRPATSKQQHHHHHHHYAKDSSSSRVRKRHRSRSRSSSRSRGLVSSDSRRRRRGGGRDSPASAPGWGGGGRNDDDYYDRARGALAASGLGGLFGGDSDTRHHASSSSRGSFFGLGNTSRSSFFNFGNRSSYYKRSPRHGFMARAYRRLKRLLRDLVHYAKRHPWKVFFLVVMPLLTTGVLGSLLARFGLRIPPSLERMLGMASRAASDDSLGLVSDAVRMAGEFGSGSSSRKTSTLSRGYDGDLQWERRSSYRSGGGGGGDGDWGNTVADLARRFF